MFKESHFCSISPCAKERVCDATVCATTLLRQRHIKAALFKLRCENDNPSTEMPPLTFNSQCCPFVFRKISFATAEPFTHKASGKGRGKSRYQECECLISVHLTQLSQQFVRD